MELHLAGRVAIVSGGSRGIGRACAQELAYEGCNVVLAARTQQHLDEARTSIGKIASGRVGAISADMRKPEGVAAVVDYARDRFGPVDIAISNVIGHVIDPAREGDGPGAGWFSTMDVNGYRDELDSLLVSSWLLARATLPDMMCRNWGRILNIGSHAAREPATDIPHVLPNTVRPAVAGLHRVLARQLVPYGVTVNNILTGAISTERSDSYWKWLANERGTSVGDVLAGTLAAFPLGRLGTPEEMAAVAAFLCSEGASAITGQSVSVMGGGTRHL